VLIALSLGGLTLAGTSLLPAWRRVRRHLARTTTDGRRGRSA
jgi:hypothetical protein